MAWGWTVGLRSYRDMMAGGRRLGLANNNSPDNNNNNNSTNNNSTNNNSTNSSPLGSSRLWPRWRWR